MQKIKVMSKLLWGALGIGLLIITASAAPISAAEQQTPGATIYYVATNGDDNHNGLTPGTAWKTLSHVSAQTFLPGDAVLFQRGDTWRETLYITSSGTPDAQITFGAYGTGNQPRILGSELALDWAQTAPNIWRSNTALENPYLGGYAYAEVFFEETDGSYRWGQQQDQVAQLSAEYDWSWQDGNIYIYAPTHPATRYAAVEAPQRDSGIRLPNVNGSTVLAEDYVEYITIDNLEIMYTRRHGFYPGYNEVTAHGLQITNNHIGMVGVKGGSSAYCIAAWHSDMLIQNNIIHDCGRRGISLNTYTTYTPGLTLRNVLIDGNHFSNGFHTTGPDISSLTGNGHTFTNFTISNNIFDDSARWQTGIHDGCYASSCTSNSLYISSQDGNQYTDFTITNNIIIGSTSRAMLLVDMDDVHIYHNTVYGSHPDAQPYGLVLFNSVTQIDLRNNIFHGNLIDIGNHNYGRGVLDEGASSFAIRDYNLYFQEDAGQPITGSEHGVGGWDVFMNEWETWQTASGFETHSPDPQRTLFWDREHFDFRLQAGSPARDAGVLIPGLNDEYHGLAPDLGALEFTPALKLYGQPAHQTIYLNWEVNSALPAETIWQIDYYTTTAEINSVTAPNSAARAHTLTGLQNYALYTVTLSAFVDANAILSDTITIMPTDILISLPLILKNE